MSNVNPTGNDLNTPHVILNADVTKEGLLVKRPGYELWCALPGAHSLFADNEVMLCATSSQLHRVESGVATSVGAVDGSCKLATVRIDDVVYFANAVCCGTYNLSTRVLGTWGLAVPAAPALSETVGNLPPGRYLVAVTVEADGIQSGASEDAAIELTSTGGILVTGIPANCTIWITEPDGSVLFRTSETSLISTTPQTTEPLLSSYCHPAFNFTSLCVANGRIYGSVGSSVYRTKPLQYQLFDGLWEVPAPSEVHLIARSDGVLYLGCEDGTYLLVDGSERKIFKRVGPASIAGTLQYCNGLGDLEDAMTQHTKTLNDVPVWLTVDGVVAGLPSGRLANLTKSKVKLFPGTKSGASAFIFNNNVFKYLTTFTRSDSSAVGFSDSATCEVVRNGKVI
jgi:hypothetical protein